MLAVLAPLPDTFAATRDAVHVLACYAVAPARKARTGHISLRPTASGIGTPPFDDGSDVSIDGATLHRGTKWTPVTTLRAAAQFLGIELLADPGVGRDLPPFRPDDELAIDPAAAEALAGWYRFGHGVLAAINAPDVSEAQLWPEHFDLAAVVTVASGARANVGFSPGDGYSAAPYVYVGPFSLDGIAGPYWNAPFGATLSYADVAAAGDPAEAVQAFIAEGLERL